MRKEQFINVERRAGKGFPVMICHGLDILSGLVALFTVWLDRAPFYRFGGGLDGAHACRHEIRRAGPDSVYGKFLFACPGHDGGIEI